MSKNGSVRSYAALKYSGPVVNAIKMWIIAADLADLVREF
jgi:hypothetical protein